MTFAWHRHLKLTLSSLWTVVLVSWNIAFFEYCLAVTASAIRSIARPSSRRSRSSPGWSSPASEATADLELAAGFALIACGAALIFKGWPAPAAPMRPLKPS